MWAAPALAITEAELFPVATTRYGKIKGITWSGVHAFKGVPYGASTAGRNRWKAPQPPASWRGERVEWAVRLGLGHWLAREVEAGRAYFSPPPNEL